MSSSEGGATAPQGWSLTEEQLHLAARASLASQTTGTNPNTSRKDAIRALVEAEFKRREQAARLQAEVEAIRGMVSEWQEGDQANSASRRAASPLPEDDDQMQRKRARTSTTTTGHLVKSSPKSAAERVFDVYELIALVCAHLVYDQADLLTLSRLSRRTRQAVLPFMVEALDVPMSRLEPFIVLFESRPALISSVKYLRIHDDIAEHASSCSTRTFHKEVFGTRSIGKADFARLSLLLGLFEKAISVNAPLVALSIGQLKLRQFDLHLLQAPRLVENLVSIRIVNDVDDDDYATNGAASDGSDSAEDDDSEFEIIKCTRRVPDWHPEDVEHSARVAELVPLLENILDRQRTSRALQSFTFHGTHLSGDEDHRPSLLPLQKKRLLNRLAKSLRHLNFYSAIGPQEGLALEALLDRYWPHLETIRADTWITNHEYPEEMNALPGKFLSRNQHIPHVEMVVRYSEEHLHPSWYLDASPSQLKSCSMEDPPFSASEMKRFSNRQPDVTSLSLWQPDYSSRCGNPRPDGVTALIAQRDFVEGLRCLQGPPHLVDLVLSQPHSLRQVHIVTDRALQGPPLPQTVAANISAPSVTLLVIQTPKDVDIAEALLNNPDRVVPVKLFPNLVELVYTIGGRRQNAGMQDTSTDASLVFLDKLLAHLCAAPERRSNKIRAIRVAYGNKGSRLPLSPDGCVAAALPLPPTLEYLSWHFGSSSTQSVQHYRVLRNSAATTQQARLQLLPASFRPKMDRRTGFWEDDLEPRQGVALFDHQLSGEQEPCLKYL
ncbi:hypothetical protein V8E36_002711 [Tilletia maclaganii]